ncbi:MAG TPA: hypothetical protein ENJ30_03400, partial [Desulfobulbaceae bacterium]|nr:hypothetical protein [Desulfobulbaceae bacterium]
MMAGSLRILAVAATYQGANDYAFVRAFRRAGHSVRVLPVQEYVPLWQGKPMRVLRKAFMSMMVAEYNQALQQEARLFQPDLFFVFKGA